VGKTGYFFHPDCRLHDMGAGHPESSARLDAIDGYLRATGLMDRLEQRTPRPAHTSELLLAHDRSYIALLRGLDAMLHDPDEPDLHYLALDDDTVMNAATYRAALLSAGAAVGAVDAVLNGELENAFCMTRPPGHHATRHQGMGFCFFNNVAIAAKYACERRGLERVAIVDFDVHHGNGTEDIVAGDERILMVGFYQHPFYPEGGARRLDPNLLNCPVPALTRGMDIRDLIDMLWLPRLDQHRPELILVSAGFDAHRDEEMADLKLNESDYLWITTQIRDVARRHARGRIVSCLEGGYSLPALARSAATHISVLAAVDLEALRANPARPSGRTC
jgi:acetoin utilization deacetylase AcuC-like enzyme